MACVNWLVQWLLEVLWLFHALVALQLTASTRGMKVLGL